MHKLFVILLLGCSIFACKQPVKGKNGVSYHSAVEYNDYIVERHTNLMKNVLEFRNVEESKLDSAEAYLRHYAHETGTMITEILGMPAYKGDSAFRDAAVRSFAFYKKVFENDYADVMRIRKKGKSNITPEDVTEANSILDNIREEEEDLDEAFRKAQENYAEKNHMQLTDNRIQKDQDRSGKDE